MKKLRGPFLLFLIGLTFLGLTKPICWLRKTLKVKGLVVQPLAQPVAQPLYVLGSQVLKPIENQLGESKSRGLKPIER